MKGQAGADTAAHLEEVDLHGAVAEVQHDGGLCPEPVSQKRQACELVTVTGSDVHPRLEQVLTHEVPEILQQSDLRMEGGKVNKQNAVQV